MTPINVNAFQILGAIALGLVVLYVAAKLVTYAILSARQLFADQQEKKKNQNNNHHG